MAGLGLMEYEYDFCVALHEKLKEKIRGKIFTIIENDILRVEVYIRNENWAIAWGDISEKILTGLSTETVSRVVARQYRNYIVKQSCNGYLK